MTIEVEVLTEVYTILKQYIPQKDNVMSVMVDMLNDMDLKELGGADSNLKKALKEYSFEDDDEETDWEE